MLRVNRGACTSLGDEITESPGPALLSDSGGLNNGMDGKC